MSSAAFGVYLHIPFCRHRCAYCDFNTYTGLSDLQEIYADALAAEVTQVAKAGRGLALPPVTTVFFGGGTPSLMSPAAIGRVLAAVRESLTLADQAEVTMEANPGTVDQAYLEEVRALGVNRLSFGMQSADPGELSLLERAHDYQGVVTAVESARTAGFDNLNLDLIYGLPDQSLLTWQHSLEATLALEPEHLSLYCLTIEPGTRMERWLDNGQITAPDPDLAAEQYEMACRVLGSGWEHYEISNWARPGRACQHNIIYWRNQDYLGLGAGAHGHAAGLRYHVVKQPRTYLRRMQEGVGAGYPLSAAVAGSQQLSREEMISDTMITQLRLLQEGLDMEAFQEKFGESVHQLYGETLEQLGEWGLLEQEENHLRLTERGWFLSNQVFYRFL